MKKRKDLITFGALIILASGLAQAEVTRLVLPVAVEERTGTEWPRYTTFIRVLNRGTEPTELTLTAYDNSGAPVPHVRFLSDNGSGPIRVESGRPAVIDIVVEDAPIFEGWVEVTLDSAADVLITAELTFFGESFQDSNSGCPPEKSRPPCAAMTCADLEVELKDSYPAGHEKDSLPVPAHPHDNF